MVVREEDGVNMDQLIRTVYVPPPTNQSFINTPPLNETSSKQSSSSTISSSSSSPLPPNSTGSISATASPASNSGEKDSSSTKSMFSFSRAGPIIPRRRSGSISGASGVAPNFTNNPLATSQGSQSATSSPNSRLNPLYSSSNDVFSAPPTKKSKISPPASPTASPWQSSALFGNSSSASGSNSSNSGNNGNNNSNNNTSSVLSTSGGFSTNQALQFEKFGSEMEWKEGLGSFTNVMADSASEIDKDAGFYRVLLAKKQGIPHFSPHLPDPPILIADRSFKDFFLAKGKFFLL